MARQSALGLWDRLLWRVIAPFAIVGWWISRLEPSPARLSAMIAVAVCCGVALRSCFAGSVTVFATDNDPHLQTRINSALTDMGYRREHQFHMVTTYVPTLRAGFWSNGISVCMAGSEAMLQGPRLHLAKLLRSLNI